MRKNSVKVYFLKTTSRCWGGDDHYYSPITPYSVLNSMCKWLIKVVLKYFHIIIMESYCVIENFKEYGFSLIPKDHAINVYCKPRWCANPYHPVSLRLGKAGGRPCSGRPSWPACPTLPCEIISCLFQVYGFVDLSYPFLVGFRTFSLIKHRSGRNFGWIKQSYPLIKSR